MPGAPVLAPTTPGSLLPIFRALANGFGSSNIDSITVSGEVGLATFSSGHALDVDAVVTLSGVGYPTDLNGDWLVTAVTASTVTFACPGIADATATGTMSGKVAGAGWSIAFDNGNKLVMRSATATGPRPYLQIDDNGTFFANVRGYETMSDESTGTNPFPPTSLTTSYIRKTMSTSYSNARPWLMFADDKFVYLFINTGLQSGSYTNNWDSFAFGEDIKTASDAADPYNALIHPNQQTSASPPNYDWIGRFESYNQNPTTYFQRYADGSTIAPFVAKTGFAPITNYGANGGSESANLIWRYPDALSNTMAMTPIMMFDNLGRSRGFLPGIENAAWKYSGTTPLFAAGSRYVRADGSAWRRLHSCGSSTGSNGYIEIKVAEPWRP